MQMLIDITPEAMEDIKNDRASRCFLQNKILNGKLLPAGHGDLIDKAKLLDEMFDKCGTECCCCEHFIINKKGCRDDCGLIFNAPTIIEADKEGSDSE